MKLVLVLCAASFFTIAEGISECPPGHYYSPLDAACFPCRAGHYYDETYRTCISCVPPMTSTEPGGHGASSCTKCRKGYYNYYGECVSCPKGSYSEIIDAPYCTRCPEGQTTDSHSADSISLCRECPAGQEEDPFGPGCRSCSPGEYNDGSFSFCRNCPYPYSSTEIGATDTSGCTKCRTAFYKDTSGDCVRCPKGTYSEELDAASCTSCPEGQTTYGRYGASRASFCHVPE